MIRKGSIVNRGDRGGNMDDHQRRIPAEGIRPYGFCAVRQDDFLRRDPPECFIFNRLKSGRQHQHPVLRRRSTVECDMLWQIQRCHHLALFTYKADL